MDIQIEKSFKILNRQDQRTISMDYNSKYQTDKTEMLLKFWMQRNNTSE